MKNYWLLFLIILTNCFSTLNSGNVYLVIGSDTAIWDGMSTSRFNDFYNIDLYVNPQRNAYRVMDPSFRAKLIDSDGQPLKMTWWMMAGNIFRYATNKNVPIPNIMTMYLMKKYHGHEVLQNGDELSLHYHTFLWYDYNGDGRYYWNQAPTFMDCFDDFNYTLAQFLLEEQVFPVSFRSGWHYMDNDWQHYLDDYILPYSMHNDWPVRHIDNEEPIDNNYDWSQAPSAFVPFRPSRENYQLPGNGPGWNVRSAHFWKVLAYDYIDTVFAAAQAGEDQVACFWGHLPESDFIQNIEKIDSVLHDRLKKYPDVNFYYCTAVEAMQRWRKAQDEQPPEVEFWEEADGDQLYFKIRSHEKIFQKAPFVAAKDVYEDYQVLGCQPVGINTWRTTTPINKNYLAKVGLAVCDTFGNQTLKFIQYLPDDVFIDNLDENFSVNVGEWQPINSGTPWGTDALMVQLSQDDSISASWRYTFTQQAYYNLFIQVPQVDNLASKIYYLIYLNGQIQDTIKFIQPIKTNEWQYLKTVFPEDGDQLEVVLQARGDGQAGKRVIADVLKITAMVRDRDLQIDRQLIDFGEVSWGDTAVAALKLKNIGRQLLTINKIETKTEHLVIGASLPVKIDPMSEIELPVQFYSGQLGYFTDTLSIESNDPKKPVIKLPVTANVEKYFEIIDNEDSAHYQEEGQWFYSVAQGYGGTSRYAWLNRTPVPSARFFTILKKSGVYNLFEIVPKTENATDKALYEIKVEGVSIDSLIVDQNAGSGNWKSLGLYYLPAGVEVEIRVIDSKKSTVGAVLRADAVKFQLVREITKLADEDEGLLTNYTLEQNYPNPFNATTNIRFALMKSELVKLQIFNLLGEKVRTLINGVREKGLHQVQWDGKNDSGQQVSSGVYYYLLETKSFRQMKKMILLK